MLSGEALYVPASRGCSANNECCQPLHQQETGRGKVRKDIGRGGAALHAKRKRGEMGRKNERYEALVHAKHYR
jgi:hypothetical protein